MCVFVCVACMRVWFGVVWCGVCVHKHVCVCLYCEGGGVGWGLRLDDKFMYVSIVWFDVSCF